jgi:hypothetical protein
VILIHLAEFFIDICVELFFNIFGLYFVYTLIGLCFMYILKVNIALLFICKNRLLFVGKIEGLCCNYFCVETAMQYLICVFS